MGKKLLAANWKMHLTLEGAQSLTSEITGKYETEVRPGLRVVLAVPAPYLHACHHLVKHNPWLAIGAQNIHPEASGAFTGEISGEMILSTGAKYVIIGHSERREYFKEDDAFLARKLTRALTTGLMPIFCIGESLAQRDAGLSLDIVEDQLRRGAFHLDSASFKSVVLAYEPVWAIGTGRTASPEQAQEVHAHLRQLVAVQYGLPVAEQCTLLYGGSVKSSNAKELFGQPDIDGGLVGGASLSSREFVEIMKAVPVGR